MRGIYITIQYMKIILTLFRLCVYVRCVRCVRCVRSMNKYTYSYYSSFRYFSKIFIGPEHNITAHSQTGTRSPIKMNSKKIKDERNVAFYRLNERLGQTNT